MYPMMTDIFSNFDPLSFSKLITTLLWILPMWGILTLTMSFWAWPSQTFSSVLVLLFMMLNLVKQTSMKNLKGSSMMMSSLFFLIVFMNLWGLIPYIFSVSTHLALTLTISLPIWLGLMMSSASNSPYNFIASMAPSGAPNWLNPFLVIIEFISTNMRPITLAFRLAANMSAGHIVVTLMSTYLSTAFFSPSLIIFLYIFSGLGYLLFEIFISLIQAFIFCLLLTLYSNDHQ